MGPVTWASVPPIDAPVECTQVPVSGLVKKRGGEPAILTL